MCGDAYAGTESSALTLSRATRNRQRHDPRSCRCCASSLLDVTSYARWPARVDTGTFSHNRAAVVISGSTARIGVLDASKKGVDVVAERHDVVEVAPHISRRIFVRFADGTEWTVERGDGCSCKSALRQWYHDERGRPARTGS